MGALAARTGPRSDASLPRFAQGVREQQGDALRAGRADPARARPRRPRRGETDVRSAPFELALHERSPPRAATPRGRARRVGDRRSGRSRARASRRVPPLPADRAIRSLRGLRSLPPCSGRSASSGAAWHSRSIRSSCSPCIASSSALRPSGRRRVCAIGARVGREATMSARRRRRGAEGRQGPRRRRTTGTRRQTEERPEGAQG